MFKRGTSKKKNRERVVDCVTKFKFPNILRHKLVGNPEQLNS